MSRFKEKMENSCNRYRESISRSTQGIKEKLLARNNSIKELSKGVCSAEGQCRNCWCCTNDRALRSYPKTNWTLQSCFWFHWGNYVLLHKGKGVEKIISPSHNGESNGVTQNMSLNASAHIFCTIPDGAEVKHVQRDHCCCGVWV